MPIDFLDSLKQSALLPVYALVGGESALVGEAVVALRNKTLSQAADLNRDEFVANDTAIEQVIEAAHTLPMMAPRRFVHLSALHTLKAKDHPRLLEYLDNPATHTVLCLSGEKVDQRTKLGQKLAQSGALFSFEAPRQQELATWLEKRARRLGVEIEPSATQLLGDLVGIDVGSLDRALEKLALYAGANAVISSDDVEAAVAPTRVHNIFALTDAIGNRDLGKASMLLHNIQGGGESALGILAMLTRQFRQLLRLKALTKTRASNKDIASALGVPPFLVGQLQAQARRYQESELVRALEAALQADVRLKSSRLGAELVLDRLLVEVVQQA